MDAPAGLAPILELTMGTTSDPPSQEVAGEVGAEDEVADEEIVVEQPLVRVIRDTGGFTATPAPTPSICRFASPPLVFNRSRPAAASRPRDAPARPRTLGEFLMAAKSRSDALMQTPAVRRRLVELNFQPRRSSRIAGQPGGLSSEMKAV